MKTNTYRQTKLLRNIEGLSLPVPVLSPYFTGSGALNSTIVKVIFEQFIFANGSNIFYGAAYMNGSSIVDTPTRQISPTAYTTISDIISAVENDILSYASSQSYSITAADILWVGLNSPSGSVSESTPTLTLQTSTGAVGTQLSASQAGWLTIEGSVSTTATIGGASAGDILVEVAPTNSATAGDWVQKGIIGNSQNITLAIVLNSVQVVKGATTVFVPAGYYAKVRSLTGSGSPTYSLIAQKFVAI